MTDVTRIGERYVGVLVILPRCSSFSLRLYIPGIGGQTLEIQSSEGVWSNVVVDMKLIPLLGICFTPQQITGMVLASLFATLSLF